MNNNRMKCLLKILNLNAPASDGSTVPYDVLQSYIDSEECKKALRDKTMVSSFTHRCRNIQSVFPDKPALLKTVGRDDVFGIVDEEAPTITHYITKLEIKSDGWLYGVCEILEEDGLDDVSIQNLRRLKGLIKNGIKIGCSCIILGNWKTQGKGTDTLVKLVQFKGVDFTFNASWKNACLVEAWEEDEDGERIKTYSENTEDVDNKLKVKTFSDLSGFDYNGPKSSKINGQYTILKAKQFSSIGTIETVEGDVPEVKETEKAFTQPETKEETPEQKNFTVAGIRDQLRERKLGVRLMFRRMILSYKQVVKSMGSNMKPEDEAILKSMLSSDVLYVLNKISDDVITKNKQINTLLGASSISKSLRLACTDLQLSYRMAGMEARKQGFVSKIRYQRLSAAYNKFVGAVLDEVFKNTDNMPKEEDDKVEEGK
jgi:hypothetical protein